MLSHEALHAETLSAARNEKSATLVLLKFLKEVEERRTFAVLGFPSLFKYVEEALGYSGAQTSERLSAMRLLKVVPEVETHLREGTHTLTSLAKVASHMRREGLNPGETRALVKDTLGQSVTALEKHLLRVAEIEPARIERTKVVSKELTRLTLDVDDDFMARVNRIRELKGNPVLPLSEIFGSAMELFIQKKDPTLKHPIETAKPDEEAPVVRPAEVPARSRYIRANDRRAVSIRAAHQCQYMHEGSGKRCDSRSGLQMEHRIPFAKRGSSREENLLLYCAAHNRLRAIQEFGEEKMRPYLKI
jgi:hypothetical protein